MWICHPRGVAYGGWTDGRVQALPARRLVISNNSYAHDEPGVNPRQIRGFDGVHYKLWPLLMPWLAASRYCPHQQHTSCSCLLKLSFTLHTAHTYQFTLFSLDRRIGPTKVSLLGSKVGWMNKLLLSKQITNNQLLQSYCLKDDHGCTYEHSDLKLI